MLRLRNAFRCVRISGIQNDFYCQSVMQLSAAPLEQLAHALPLVNP